MGRFNEIDYTIQEIKNWFKDHIAYIVAIIAIIIIAILVYGQADRDIKKAQEKENRINRIETRLNEQMYYIDKLEADVDSLKEIEHIEDLQNR